MVAVGFELAILVTGMAVILTGDRRLLVGEIVLVALSVATAWWTILGQDQPVPRWVQAATLGLMPLQYLIATASLHRLYTLGQSRRSSGSSTVATTTRRRRVEMETTESVVATAAGQHLASLSAGQSAKIEEYLAAVARVGREDEDVAGVLGVSERTVRRYRSVASAAGLLTPGTGS